MASSAKMEGPSAPAVRRDPYEVLSVPRDSSDQEIKSAYRKLALKSVPPFSSMLLFMLLCSVNLFARFRGKTRCYSISCAECFIWVCLHLAAGEVTWSVYANITIGRYICHICVCFTLYLILGIWKRTLEQWMIDWISPDLVIVNKANQYVSYSVGNFYYLMVSKFFHPAVIAML